MKMEFSGVEFTLTVAGQVIVAAPNSLSFRFGYDHECQPNIKKIAPLTHNGLIALSQLRNMRL